MELLLVDIPVKFDCLEEYLRNRLTSPKIEVFLVGCELVRTLCSEYPLETLDVETGVHLAKGQYAWLREFREVLPSHHKRGLRTLLSGLFRDRLYLHLDALEGELALE